MKEDAAREFQVSKLWYQTKAISETIWLRMEREIYNENWICQ